MANFNVLVVDPNTRFDIVPFDYALFDIVTNTSDTELVVKGKSGSIIDTLTATDSESVLGSFVGTVSEVNSSNSVVSVTGNLLASLTGVASAQDTESTTAQYHAVIYEPVGALVPGTFDQGQFDYVVFDVNIPYFDAQFDIGVFGANIVLLQGQFNVTEFDESSFDVQFPIPEGARFDTFSYFTQARFDIGQFNECTFDQAPGAIDHVSAVAALLANLVEIANATDQESATNFIIETLTDHITALDTLTGSAGYFASLADHLDAMDAVGIAHLAEWFDRLSATSLQSARVNHTSVDGIWVNNVLIKRNSNPTYRNNIVRPLG